MLASVLVQAAQKLAALKQQRSMLHKEITKIAKKDV